MLLARTEYIYGDGRTRVPGTPYMPVKKIMALRSVQAQETPHHRE